MKKSTIKSLLLSISTSALFAFSSANAVDYTVQVGAYQVLTNDAIRKAEPHGEVYQSVGTDNLTRLHIGRFSTHSQAEEKRDQLRSSGFSDAFVTQISVSGQLAKQAPVSSYQEPTQEYQTPIENNSYTQSSTSSHSNSANLSGLTADEKRKAAFLDGKLRIYSDGQFYTLEQYRQTKQF